MRMLFELDKKDYDCGGNVFRRPSARGIIVKDGKAAMVYSKKYDYYKFPGGGIEAGERMEDALTREVLEETGLRVVQNSLREYGQVHRVQKGKEEDIFIQDNYYFFCEVQEVCGEQKLDAYEEEEEFTLVFVSPQAAIDVNRRNGREELQVMLEREARILELLLQEGYFGQVHGRMDLFPQPIQRKKPEMIWFDYGQTLVAERKFDGVKGTAAVLRYAIKNKYHLSAEQVQAKADEINRELGRFQPEKRHLCRTEIPTAMFSSYLYESLGIEIGLSSAQRDTVFWDAAAPGVPTEGIKDFLKYLKSRNIRTGVISNISYDPSVVAERIHRLLPENTFEFIVTSSNYMFRKPDKRLFGLALEKAGVRPDEVWYVGDQYECDINGARNAGLLPVWYIGAMDLPYAEDNSVLTVKAWEELRERMEGNL